MQATADGVVLGNRWKTHLLLSRDGISRRLGVGALEAFAWEEIEGITLHVPTSRFRFPGVAARAISVPVRLLNLEMWDLEPPSGAVDVTAGGEQYRLDIDRHHFGGYWHLQIIATQQMLDRLLADPGMRELLDDPGRMLDSVARMTR
ncbi:hypothetical protein [Microbacterium sp. SA39]|uniref:hypothetical protein n=1 Tax=Microbacterium sp. SA39 TaxID=1263625 RepID=UPI0005FA25E6|nr:hypothetical protein [Microbacterium sp. SA39]KJQ52723.1 hypothetical protein RS85_03617 [Microbacterium sp. SA39]